MTTARLLTPAEVAKLLRVSPQTVLNWIEREALPAIVLPYLPEQKRREYRIHPDDLRAALGGEPLPPEFLNNENGRH